MNQSSCFRDITLGNNGAYSATAGWDATTGLGSPLGMQLIQAEQSTATQAAVTKGTRIQT
jgi:kumamolisin